MFIEILLFCNSFDFIVYIFFLCFCLYFLALSHFRHIQAFLAVRLYLRHASPLAWWAPLARSRLFSFGTLLACSLLRSRNVGIQALCRFQLVHCGILAKLSTLLEPSIKLFLLTLSIIMHIIGFHNFRFSPLLLQYWLREFIPVLFRLRIEIFDVIIFFFSESHMGVAEDGWYAICYVSCQIFSVFLLKFFIILDVLI